jgi:heavy metal translocating P-type ATPase
MVVERSHGARAIDGVVASVERLLASRAPIQGVADRLARWLAVAVLSAAAVTAMLVLVHHGAVADAALRAAAVVVVACPCALGLATPMALVVAAGTAAKRGMLFRDGAALERAAAVQRVFLDKTGTVTEGRPAIAGVDAAQASRHDVIAVAAAAERGLDHPVARAIAALSPDAILEGHREVVPGAGVRVTRPNGDVVVGSAAFLATAGVMVPTNGNAGTVAHVARAGVHLGSIRLHDEPRAGVRVAVAELARLGLRPHLVSGDRESAVRPLADELGASFDAERSPDEKARAVEAARRAGHVVAFVGDGVNDAPALAAADVGIAVGGATDGASALSAVVLRHGGAERIPEVLAFARRVRSVMRQNLAWAIGYNLVAIPVAAMGLASPALAAGLMTFSSVSVVVNSLRLIRA